MIKQLYPLPDVGLRKQKTKSGIYLYKRGKCYRDENKKVKRTNDTLIGKLDEETGFLIPNKNYFVIFDKPMPKTHKLSNEYSTGYVSCYMNIFRQLGISDILLNIFGDEGELISHLAGYMVPEGNVMEGFKDWAQDHRIPERFQKNSQRLSEFFEGIMPVDIEEFKNKWSNSKCFNSAFYAYDVTSISSYSENIDELELGYNRDKELLRQINLSVLLDRNVHLPLLYDWYSGSLNDKTYLPYAIEMMQDTIDKKISLVMDQGFHRSETFKDLERRGIEFLTLLPSNLKTYDDLIDKCNAIGFKHVDRLSNPQKRAKTLDITLQGLKLKAHVIKDQDLFNQQLVSFYNDLDRKEQELKLLQKTKKLVRPGLTALFNVTQSKDLDLAYEPNNEAIDLAISRLGFIVLITNHPSLDAETALHVYRKKGLIEKAFDNLKNGLDFSRLRVHSGDRVEGKLFIGFIALILRMHMIHCLSSHELTKNIGLKRSIKELKKINTYKGKLRSTTAPLTKMQKNILTALNITL
ncbi:IS1634 family transposase [Basilea psittacipulmonis]|uniref:Transposase IS4-like domain-containing protein n=3 Tax=Basilea TaxID=1472344 RepID=A0A077DD34_9BURK|nr:transposase [Basilea psittacipulmonis]AIL32227.1 hypothetical protein IX83_01890 [Basilea psittacipulmonis DSM 24701]AIL32740.1 hypothetical protein IX83_04950 [Basilea psittacipulmonis DSM 24701]